MWDGQHDLPWRALREVVERVLDSRPRSPRKSQRTRDGGVLEKGKWRRKGEVTRMQRSEKGWRRCCNVCRIGFPFFCSLSPLFSLNRDLLTHLARLCCCCCCTTIHPPSPSNTPSSRLRGEKEAEDEEVNASRPALGTSGCEISNGEQNPKRAQVCGPKVSLLLPFAV